MGRESGESEVEIARSQARGEERGRERTTGLCIMPALSSLRQLSAAATRRSSRAPPPGGQENLVVHDVTPEWGHERDERGESTPFCVASQEQAHGRRARMLQASLRPVCSACQCAATAWAQLAATVLAQAAACERGARDGGAGGSKHLPNSRPGHQGVRDVPSRQRGGEVRRRAPKVEPTCGFSGVLKEK